MSYGKRLLFFAAGCAVVFVAGCGQSSSYKDGGVVQRAGDPNVVGVRSEDAAMNAAMRTARSTVQTFITALKAQKPGQLEFAVKKRFSDSYGDEHMWIGDLRYDGKAFHGRLNNRPVDVRAIKLGDAVTVAPDEISDWMYVDNGKLVGGYTIRVLVDKLPPNERKQVEQESGYTIS
jgi:uncharacterized protein YegJ (DUF2314 family)